jgi:hypothetical protein
MASGERSGVVQAEQLGVSTRLHQFATAVVEVQPARDPAPPGMVRRILPSSSCRGPRFPNTSPRAGWATISPRGVTRFWRGTLARIADASIGGVTAFDRRLATAFVEERQSNRRSG